MADLNLLDLQGSGYSLLGGNADADAEGSEGTGEEAAHEVGSFERIVADQREGSERPVPIQDAIGDVKPRRGRVDAKVGATDAHCQQFVANPCAAVQTSIEDRFEEAGSAEDHWFRLN